MLVFDAQIGDVNDAWLAGLRSALATHLGILQKRIVFGNVQGGSVSLDVTIVDFGDEIDTGAMKADR